MLILDIIARCADLIFSFNKYGCTPFFSLHRLSLVFPKILNRPQCHLICQKYLLARLFALGSDAKVSLVWREVWTADDLLSAILGRPHLRLWRYANACPSDDGLSSKSDSSSLPSLVSVSFIFWCKVLILVSIAAWTLEQYFQLHADEVSWSDGSWLAISASTSSMFVPPFPPSWALLYNVFRVKFQPVFKYKKYFLPSIRGCS